MLYFIINLIKEIYCVFVSLVYTLNHTLPTTTVDVFIDAFKASVCVISMTQKKKIEMKVFLFVCFLVWIYFINFSACIKKKKEEGLIFIALLIHCLPTKTFLCPRKENFFK